MKRLVLLGVALSVAASLSLSATVAGAEGPLHPFTPEGSTAALKEKIGEDFPAAFIPAQEGILCSSAEHSLDGPVSYCFGEFAAEGTWNLVAASRQFAAIAEPGGASVSIYEHTRWRRQWERCHLGGDVPGKLLSNERCGHQQGRQLSQDDAELVEFEVLPKLRSHKPVWMVSRDLPYAGVAPSLYRYRASRRGSVYTFTNAVGDSFRYRAPRRLAGSK